LLLAAGVLVPALLLQATPAAPDSAPRARLRVFPVGSYSDVTGLQFGAGMLLGFRTSTDSARASSLSANATLTTKDHAKAYVQLDRWSADNALRTRARVEYTSYPLPYFGIGRNTPESAEEWNNSGVTTMHLFFQEAIAKPHYVHAGIRTVWSDVHNVEPGGAIDRGEAPGAGRTNVTALELGPVIDSRDDIGAATTGSFTRATVSVGSRAVGDFSFRRFVVDARRYARLGAGSVIAMQFQYDGLFGNLPFDQLPMIGADTAMRGYPRGRFRDKQAVTAQVELRSAYRRRVAAVAFAGAGTVAPVFGKLPSGTWFPTAGAGVRALLSPRWRVIGRMDLGFGRGSWGVNVGLGEAF
jgi:outer membrane protein assembly factor BamA